MKNLLLMTTLILIAVTSLVAQKNADAEQTRKSILGELTDIKKEQQTPINSLLTAEVGEPDSFVP